MTSRTHLTAAPDSARMGSPSRPIRTCVGCRRKATKSALLRVVATQEGGTVMVRPDLRGSAPGRGAHLHPVVDCLDLAVRRRAFVRALRVQGPIDLSAVEAMVRHSAQDARSSSNVSYTATAAPTGIATDQEESTSS